MYPYITWIKAIPCTMVEQQTTDYCSQTADALKPGHADNSINKCSLPLQADLPQRHREHEGFFWG
jgi:hypothetical protein